MNDLALTTDIDLRGEQDRPSAIAQRSTAQFGSKGGVTIKTLPEAVEFAKLMCQARQGVPKPFRNEPGLCLAVTMQSLRWGFDPFGVAQNAYVVNDKVAYEAKVIKAAIDANAGLAEPLDFVFEGKDGKRFCRAVGKLFTAKGAVVERIYETPPIDAITPKNSPLWKTDPDQQLTYFAARSWARRFVPGVLLGVFTIDEVQDMGPVINAEAYEKPLAEQFSESKRAAEGAKAIAPPVNDDVDSDDDLAPDDEAEAPIEEVEGEAGGEPEPSPREVAAALCKVLVRAPHLTALEASLTSAGVDGRIDIIDSDEDVKASFDKFVSEQREKLSAPSPKEF